MIDYLLYSIRFAISVSISCSRTSHTPRPIIAGSPSTSITLTLSPCSTLLSRTTHLLRSHSLLFSLNVTVHYPSCSAFPAHASLVDERGMIRHRVPTYHLARIGSIGALKKRAGGVLLEDMEERLSCADDYRSLGVEGMGQPKTPPHATHCKSLSKVPSAM